MKKYLIFAGCFFILHSVFSQNNTSRLFESDEPLSLTLSGNLRPLMNDRNGSPKKFNLTLSYFNEENSEITIPVEVKTRGHFRRTQGNCTYPPLQIKFPKENAELAVLFKDETTLKLVMPCKGDEYVVREWLVYKLYNLVTPKSFRARLVKLTLQDEAKKKQDEPFYGLLLESEKAMAKRNDMVTLKKNLKPKQIKQESFLTMAVFEYLIANTDWSVQYQQNTKLVMSNRDTLPTVVPYDFDHAGIVDAPYAQPAPELSMNSIRQRRFRGYCLKDLTIFEPIFAKFNLLKKDIYATYSECELLDSKYKESTIKYLDEFFKTINNSNVWQKEFSYPCDPNGTGNVVIKGLKEP